MTTQYDYIIIGSGCAGLSLAYHMSQNESLRKKRVLLLDNAAKTTNDKTWCFWAKEKQPYQSAQKVSWNKLEFKADDLRIREQLSEYHYYHISSLDFYQEVFEHLKQFENFEIVQEAVSELIQRGNHVEVSTQNNVYKANFAFNSVVGLLKDKPNKAGLKQHFYGKKIKTEDPKFKDGHVKLMDFSMPDKQTVQFGYLLPFSDHEALVEYTEFSPQIHSDQEYEALFKGYITGLNLGKYEIIESEKGQIPMSNFKFPRYSSSRILNMGTSGGFTKPTTGYTFKNIQDDVATIVSSLAKNKPFNRPHAHSRFRFYDRLLLGIIKDEPHKVKVIMQSLFKNNSMERILTFLDEKTSLAEEAKIFMRLPWAPFLKQLFLK